MARQMGYCSACGQEFKRSRISGRESGYRVVSDGRHGTTIRCRSCGQKTTIDGPPA